MNDMYDQDLDRNPANYVPLSPLTFLERTASVYPERIALIHGARRQSWGETYRRCRQLASALAQRGIGKGDTVAVMLPNIPEMLEVHFGVPMTGAVLNTLNTRLDPAALAYMLDHARARVLIVDHEFSGIVAKALELVKSRPLVVDVDDPLCESGYALGEIDYETFIAAGDPEFAWSGPDDEWQAISLNYTSGTTGKPKGVVYHHRGAYLNAAGNALAWALGEHPIYLWTLPMFHCNGWCFPWTIAAMGGTQVCLRRVVPEAVLEAIREHSVTHLCGAPVVLNGLVNAPEQHKRGIDHKVRIMTAGAPPPAAVIAGVEAMGFEVTHVYGLTETYGPVTICAWHKEWDAESPEQRARLKSRQGVRYQMLEGLMVADPDTLEPVPRDGETMGEIFMRGNNVMKGYLKDRKESEQAFAGGWFHSGDLAVWHPDGYIEIRDRSKDIIISGGENISSIEVEDVLYRHPAIMEAAVVARPDEKWGETPCAFVALKAGKEASEQEIIEFCRASMAHFKAPKTIVFGELPKTSTGKIQKFMLRQRAEAM
jgi:fatty-acyl-CoA synthase